jgi:cell filamentation protein
VRYPVYYAPRSELEHRVDQALGELDGGEALRTLDVHEFARRMAVLYAALDYAHPFLEGNSRTLRSFTSQLANVAGFELDWDTSDANSQTRDRLYMARDREVLERAFPGLDAVRASSTTHRREYEAYLALVRVRQGETLSEVIAGSSRRIG